jgi:hypothetical protein
MVWREPREQRAMHQAAGAAPRPAVEGDRHFGLDGQEVPDTCAPASVMNAQRPQAGKSGVQRLVRSWLSGSPVARCLRHKPPMACATALNLIIKAHLHL